MRSKTTNCITATPDSYTQLWSNEGIPILEAEFNYLILSADSDSRPLKRINSYYQRMIRQLIRFCVRILCPRLIDECNYALQHSLPFYKAKIVTRSKLTFNDDGVLCIFTDIEEFNSSIGLYTRLADVWSLTTGCPLTISSFFPKGVNFKKLLKRYAFQESERLRTRDLALFRQDTRKNTSKFFSPSNFYINNEGLVLFYPPDSIAPRQAGIPEFTLKWNDSGPVRPQSLS